MSYTDFYSTVPGRILCLTAALGLAGPAVMSILGPGHYDIAAETFLIGAVVVGCLFALLLSIEEDPGYTVKIFHRGAVVGFAYVLALLTVPGKGMFLGVLLLVAAMVPLVLAFGAPLFPRGHGEPASTGARA